MKAFPPFRIFPAAPGDIPTIAQLHYQCWIETYTGLIEFPQSRSCIISAGLRPTPA